MSVVLIRSPLIRVHADGRTARSLLVHDGIVRAVDPEVVPPGTTVLDLDAVVVPGLIDTHPHLLHFALATASCVALFDAADHADIVRRLATRAAATPIGQWIMATPIGEPHYFERRSWRSLPEGSFPDRAVLDRASTDHPIMIQAWSPTCPNVCALNSAGLAVLGIGRGSPATVGGVTIEQDGSGEPTGVLRGSVNTNYNPDPYFQELLGRLPPPTVTDPLGAVEAAIAEHHRRGVTAIFEPHAMELRHVDVYRRLREQGRLTMRVAAVPELQRITRASDPRKSAAELLDTLREARAAATETDEWVRVFGICVSAHGGTPNTGAMPHDVPYRGPDGVPTTGTWALDRDAVAQAIRFCADEGLRFNACTVGTAEHDLLLDLIDELGVDASGWIIQHGMLMRPDQIERVAALGMVVTYCAGFTPGIGPVFADRFDDDSASHLNPVRAWIDSGVPVAGSTDWGPASPWEQMRLAEELHRVSPAETFAMWTAGGSRVLGWPEIGSLAEGSHADLVALSSDVLQRDEPIEVLATLVGGADVTPA
jgi:predicted amidohydrolase YtcJ